MNREEEITNAALEECAEQNLDCKWAFMHGAKWADEHPDIIWHNSNKEQPTPGSRVLVLSNEGSIEVLTNVLEVFEDRKWLYLDKFLTKMEK